MKNMLKGLSFILIIMLQVIVPTIVMAGNPINIDGYFDDWEDKPHTPLTKGQITNSGSLFLDGEALFGHIKLDYATGNEFPNTPMTLTINNQHKVKFRIMHRNADNSMGDNINKLPEGNNLDLSVYNNNTSDWLGNAGITVIDSDHRAGDEAELYISLESLRQFCDNIPVNEMRTITLSCPNIGKEDLTITGTSTSPYIGVVTVIGVVVLIYMFRKRKQSVI